MTHLPLFPPSLAFGDSPSQLGAGGVKGFSPLAFLLIDAGLAGLGQFPSCDTMSLFLCILNCCCLPPSFYFQGRMVAESIFGGMFCFSLAHLTQGGCINYPSSRAQKPATGVFWPLLLLYPWGCQGYCGCFGFSSSCHLHDQELSQEELANERIYCLVLGFECPRYSSESDWFMCSLSRCLLSAY